MNICNINFTVVRYIHYLEDLLMTICNIPFTVVRYIHYLEDLLMTICNIHPLHCGQVYTTQGTYS